jgi:penicillin-binding protein 2
MRIGKSGVELSMEGRLRGVGGLLKQEVDARGRVVRTLERTDPQPGRDVAVTIAADLQARVLARVRQERRAAAVVLDVTTGAVRAIAYAPSRDASELTAEDWKRIEQAPDDPLFNRALLGLYPPGSTFKMVTALAGLESGAIDARTKITCEGTYHYADQAYRCWNRSGHGEVDLHRALRESCDCYFYEVGRRTGINALAAMAQRLGFGQTFANGIARQRSGIVPTPDWKRARFAKPWYGGETLHAAIGQGYVLATPLQMAVMTARLATGRAVTPALVLEAAPSPHPALEIAPAHLQAVRRGMIAVVNEDGGTGHNAQLDDDDDRFGDVRIAGKTGTSQVHHKSSRVSADELRWEQRDHALFVGYAPVRQPRFAVAAVVEHGASGGRVAAPLVRDIMRLVLTSEAVDLGAAPGTPRDAASPRRAG